MFLLDETINYNEIVEAFQRVADGIIYAYNEIKKTVLKIWENLKIIILKNKKIYKYIKRYNKCKNLNKRKHYMKKILKILKE